MGQVRQDIVSRATPEQLERMRKAEAARGVYRAWNAVCGGTREGEHVTGLRYLSDQNKLLVYLDDAVWTQEMTMLREIIRARMEREGVRLDGFVFRTTKPGFKRSGVERPRGEKKTAPIPPSTAWMSSGWVSPRMSSSMARKNGMAYSSASRAARSLSRWQTSHFLMFKATSPLFSA